MCIFCLRVQLSLNQCNVWLRPSLEEIIKWVDCCLNFYCSTFDPAKINSMGRSSCLLNQLVLINCMGIHSKATLSKTRSLLSNKLEDLDGMGFAPRGVTQGASCNDSLWHNFFYLHDFVVWVMHLYYHGTNWFVPHYPIHGFNVFIGSKMIKNSTAHLHMFLLQSWIWNEHIGDNFASGDAFSGRPECGMWSLFTS